MPDDVGWMRFVQAPDSMAGAATHYSVSCSMAGAAAGVCLPPNV
jgi:hypothetical protein